MSFDVFLNDPTGQPLAHPVRAEALSVLDRYGARPFDTGDGFSVRWDDGTGFALHSRSFGGRPGPFHALLSPLGGLGRRFCDFVYEFALATRCTISPDVIPPLTLVVSPDGTEHRTRGPSKAPTVVRVSSGHDVRNALRPGYTQWRDLLEETAGRPNKAT